MVQPMPESVKMARARVSVDTSVAGERFPITLAPDEIILLSSLYYFWYGTPVAGNNIISLGLWRKTDSDPTLMSRIHTDMLWIGNVQKTLVTESIESGGSEQVIFPAPLVLIRAPRLVTVRVLMTSVTVDMTLYYVIRKVNDVDLAKLMVKDHA